MSDMKFPQYTKAAQQGNKGTRIVETIVQDQLGWIFREQEGQKDFGIDAHIELMENGKVLGKIFAAQIKCGKTYFKRKTTNGYIFEGEEKHLNYFLNYSVPVILIICDAEIDKCWWCKIDLQEIELTNKAWRIEVPFHQTFTMEAKDKLSTLAGVVKDYFSELQKSQKMNDLAQRDGFIFIIATKQDIELGNIDFVLDKLDSMLTSKKYLKSFQSKIDISIFGYENDRRELFDIPEVRNWVNKLDKVFPYWFFFLSKKLPSLAFITFALCKYRRVSNKECQLDNKSLGNFITNHFINMNKICLRLGFTEKEIRQLSDEIFAYYKGESHLYFYIK